MTSVAGDFYDFLLADDQHAGLLIADVSGHGVPAALIASMVKMAATSQRSQAAHPAALLAGMNAALCGNTQGQYVTAAYVYLDAQSRELHYSAAGHPAMLLFRDGGVIEIAENGMLLAAIEDANYSTTVSPENRRPPAALHRWPCRSAQCRWQALRRTISRRRIQDQFPAFTLRNCRSSDRRSAALGEDAGRRSDGSGLRFCRRPETRCCQTDWKIFSTTQTKRAAEATRSFPEYTKAEATRKSRAA